MAEEGATVASVLSGDGAIKGAVHRDHGQQHNAVQSFLILFFSSLPPSLNSDTHTHACCAGIKGSKSQLTVRHEEIIHALYACTHFVFFFFLILRAFISVGN